VEDTTTPTPNFLFERIKELQNLQTGIGSTLKNFLNPMGNMKEPPIKMKDLQLAMTIIPKLMPYVLEANTPKLKTFLKVGTRYRAHNTSFSSQLWNGSNKLERLSMSSLFGLVKYNALA
jgi:hypothetical protein